MINYKIRDGFHILLTEFDEYPIKSNKLCGMCHEPVDKDTDYCSECRDFVGTVMLCDVCNGEGEYDTIIKESFASQRIDPRYEKVKCEACNGEGVI